MIQYVHGAFNGVLQYMTIEYGDAVLLMTKCQAHIFFLLVIFFSVINPDKNIIRFLKEIFFKCLGKSFEILSEHCT